MIKSLLVAMAISAAATPASIDVYTAYTPYGNAVQIVSVDPSTHDDDTILTMDDGAEIYISMECKNDAYTLYTIAADGIHEMWFYGYHTGTWADDIAADWQIWPYPSVKLMDGYTD